MPASKPNRLSIFNVSLGLCALLLSQVPAAATPDEVLKQAKAAYDRNDCGAALAGFSQYLLQATPPAEKKSAIAAAVKWCEKKQQLAAQSRTSFRGVASGSPLSRPAPVPVFVPPPGEVAPPPQVPVGDPDAKPELP